MKVLPGRLTRALTGLVRFRSVRPPERLMPSILFDLNSRLAEDTGIVPQDVIDALERRR